MNKNIIVTGGAGYIGSQACKELALNGYNPITIDNLSTGNKWSVRWGPFIECDLLDLELLETIFDKYKPSAVMHFAANAYVGESIVHPNKYYQNNVIGSLNLLNTMNKKGVTKIVFSSTCATYGIPQIIPIKETTEQIPINPYGTSKLIVEHMLKNYEKNQNIKSISLRYFNAAGADIDLEVGECHDPETHLLPLLFDVAAGNSKYISIFGNDYNTLDGTCIRDYIHVKDIALAHVLAIKYLQKHNKTSFMNLGTGNGYSVEEIIQSVSTITKKTINKKYEKRREGDPPELVSCGELAKEHLSWVPKYSDLETIIRSGWDWYNKKSSFNTNYE